MPQVEAGACEKPVIGIRAMGMLDTLVDGETALLAGVAEKIVVNEVVVGKESGFEIGKRRSYFYAPYRGLPGRYQRYQAASATVNDRCRL